MYTIRAAIEKIVQRQDLTALEMKSAMWAILSGAVLPAQLGGFLVGMRMKGESVEELVAAVQVLRELVVPVHIQGQHLVDIVGTGGDHSHTFNISTTSAFVVAAAGGQVAKHGNRSMSSRSGSADVLEAAGINLMLTPEQVAECVAQLGIGFMFTQQHHTAMKHAAGPRKDLGIRTLFNLIGPLTNPANTPRQLIGVFAREWVAPIAQVLQRIGSRHALIVHAEDGLDELSINTPTWVAELKDNKIQQYSINPQQLGFQSTPLENLQVEDAKESLLMLQSVLQNKPGPAHDIVTLNAGAAIYVAGLAPDIVAGVHKAKEALASGAANQKFQALINLSQELAQ